MTVCVSCKNKTMFGYSFSDFVGSFFASLESCCVLKVFVFADESNTIPPALTGQHLEGDFNMNAGETKSGIGQPVSARFQWFSRVRKNICHCL